MATIYGVLGVADTTLTVTQVGQSLVYNAINDFYAATEAKINQLSRLLVQGDTTNYSETYLLPASGMMQTATRLTRPGAIKATGSWSTAYPLEDMRDQIAADDVTLAYMDGTLLQSYVDGVAQRYRNTRRYLMLRAVLNKTDETVADPLYGNLTIRRLANGDATLYPATGFGGAEATAQHYLGTNYTSANISDTNNPIKTVRALLRARGGGRMVMFINSAQQDKIEALTAFYDKVPTWVTVGSGTGTATADGIDVPGDFIGAAHDVAIFVWDEGIPADYAFGLNVDAPAPLKRRLDGPAELRGFKLVARQSEFPLQESFFRAREGYGVANRLNGVALQFVASTTYTTPAAYA